MIQQAWIDKRFGSLRIIDEDRTHTIPLNYLARAYQCEGQLMDVNWQDGEVKLIFDNGFETLLDLSIFTHPAS